MRRRRRALLRLLIPVMVVGLVYLAASTIGDRTVPVSSAQGATGPGWTLGGRPSERPAGIPAIQRRSDSTPSYTTADAVQYATTHQMWRNLSASRSSVVSVRFMSGGTVETLLHTSIGEPSDAVMCYVEMTGTFTFPGLNGPVSYHRGFEVFDASTGNLLLAGGRP